MFVVAEERLIKADPESVYEISANTLKYADWNPWNISASEEAVVGGFTDITVKLGGKTMVVTHKILTMEPGKAFKWCDTGFFTHFAYGERTRTFSKTDDGTLYRCELRVTGVLSFIAKLLYAEKIRSGMQAESDALKRVAENA